MGRNIMQSVLEALADVDDNEHQNFDNAAGDWLSDPIPQQAPVIPDQISQADVKFGEAFDSARFSAGRATKDLQAISAMSLQVSTFISKLQKITLMSPEEQKVLQGNKELMLALRDIVELLEASSDHIKNAREYLEEATRSADREITI